MFEAQDQESCSWAREMVDDSFADLSAAAWSDPSQPVTFSDEVFTQAYYACATLSLSELGALVVFAQRQNSSEHNNILHRFTGGYVVGEFEPAVAALILLWHEKATEAGV